MFLCIFMQTMLVHQIILAVQLVVTFLLIVAIVLPLVNNSYWIFRIFEYPRFQIWLCVSIVLCSWVFTFQDASIARKIIAGALAAGFIYLTRKIIPYTPVSKRQMKTVPPTKTDDQLKVFTANVYQDNRQYDRIKQQIAAFDPDVVLLVETDEGWKKAVDSLLKGYPNFAGKALSNTYGMLMYTRLKIVNAEVRYLVENDIPGIRATVELPSGKPVNIWAVHPKPPVPGESEDSKAKDSEIMKVAFEAEKSEHPVIVMGDFNDVAWSKVTELFQKTARLLDPRRGRGFYSTFSANSRLLRFPLDYIFCSKQFGLISMKKLPKNGSDHFAIFTHLQYDERLEDEQHVEHTDKGERQEAVEKAEATN
jgi:endonuclease/exonuclease/phosphatase (EEP) superfamily protein YafD